MSRRRLLSAGVFLMAWLGLPGLGLAQSLTSTSATAASPARSFLRSALGLQQTPPNAVLISLALFVTAFVMPPVLERAYEIGIAPLLKEEIDEREAIARASEPLQAFMLDHTAWTPRRRDSPRAG